MPVRRSVQVTLSTDDGGFSLKVKESEVIKDSESGEQHTESDGAKTTFGVAESAVEAATRQFAAFIKKLDRPEGELFGQSK